jgi:hypothetical protein
MEGQGRKNVTTASHHRMASVHIFGVFGIAKHSSEGFPTTPTGIFGSGVIAI